ncbi:MAG: iron(III) transport system substrate-binding protein [Hyphomicrobiales bacterium]|nr:iron(III) transport system substrate-binding protein [Hyphomicrobiales bacterium]
MAVFAEPVRAAAPASTAVNSVLIEAARKEGKIALYSALDLTLSEKLAKAFEATYPGIPVRVERSGAERIFQRIGQELTSRIQAVDVVLSTDAAHFVAWKRSGWLAPYVPEDVAQHFPMDAIDADGMYANLCASLSSIGYNTNLVRSADAPRSFADLLDPKWRGKLVKAHPAYSGTILTATFAMARELGWSYFEKLARQKVMQVQSASDPPKKLALGERAVQADGADAILLQLKEQGQPVELVYASEGAPLITTPGGVFRSAPNPNAARLFQSFLCSVEGQRVFVDGNRHPFHALVKVKPGRTPLSAIKLMKSDPATVEAQSEEIKARYTKLFGV